MSTSCIAHLPRRLLLPCVLILVLLTGSGCSFFGFNVGSRPQPHHDLLSFNTTAKAATLHRIAVLPFYLNDGVGRTAQTIDEGMPASLRELALSEIITVSIVKRDTLVDQDPLLTNSITSDQLLKIRDELHCDGVFFGRVEQYDSFDPISIGVSAHIISCLDGSVVWSATGHFDGQRSDVQSEVEYWYNHSNGTSTSNISGWKTVLQSPRLFTRYVTDRLAQSIPIAAAK